MNGKNNETNNAQLSFKEKIKMYNNQSLPSNIKNNMNNEKNINNLEKKSNINQFRNTLQTFNNNNIVANEYSKIENKLKIENEKIFKSNNEEDEKKSEIKNKFELSNLQNKKMTQKRKSRIINPFIVDDINSKNPLKKEENLIERIKKLNYNDKNINEKIENKYLNKEEKNIKHKKSEKKNVKDKAKYIGEVKENLYSLDVNNISSKRRFTIFNSNKNKLHTLKNIDNMNKSKECNINKFNNNENDIFSRKRYSIKVPTNKPLFNKEKLINFSPKEAHKISIKKSNSPKNNALNKKSINSKNKNPFINDYENNNFIHQNPKKKTINLKKDDTKKNEFLENRIKTNTVYITKNTNTKKEKVEEVLLEEIPISLDTKLNSFCKAFIVSSIPKDNMTLIENAEEEKSSCGHEECSHLPAIEPRLIYKYPEKDSKELEITNNLGYFCFPNYIKLCIHDDESKIIPEKNIQTCLTNQIGDRYYTMMFHFFVKISVKAFYDQYKVAKEIKEKIELIKKSKNIEYIYIPYCIGLISKYTFFWQMNICLESIFLTLCNPNIKYEEFKEVLNYLINSVPSPYINTSIHFPIPNCSHLIELYPCFYQDIQVNLTTPITLVDHLTPNNILILLRLLLMEQKILLISSDFNILTQVSLNLISLMYPFSWVNVYIPIITSKIVRYLESFLPFFSGMHKNLYEKEKIKDILYKCHNDLYIFDIDQNLLEISKNIEGKNKVNSLKYLNSHVPNFPKKIEDLMMSQLAILKSYYKNSKDKSKMYNYNKREVIISNCIKMKEIFIQAFIELFFEYKKYLSIIGDIPIFNTKSFIKDKKESEKSFFNSFTNTQIFQIFIQNSSNYINNNNRNQKYYFDELIEEYCSKRKNNDKKTQKNYYIILNNEFENKMNKHLFKTSKIYYTKLSNLKLFEKINASLKDKKGLNYITILKSLLNKDFKYHNLLNVDGKLKNNYKIINHNLTVFDNLSSEKTKNIKYYSYFMTEEELAEKEINLEQNIKKVENKQEEKKINNDENRDDNKIKNDISKKEKEKIELEQESIRDNIDAKVRKIFRSEKIDIKKDSEILLSSTETEYGKNYFLSLFTLNNKVKQVKFLNEDSYKILFEVITKSLLKLSLKNSKDKVFAMRLMKTFSYYKILKEKEEISFISKIIDYLSSKSFKLFQDEKFWEMWFEDELKEIDKELLDQLKAMSEDKENVYYYIDEEDEKVIQFKNKGKLYIKELIKYMSQVKKGKSFILTIVGTLCDKYIQIDEFKSKIVSEIMAIGKEKSKK